MIGSGKEITILIVDDSLIARRALQMIFETQPDFRVVGEATTGAEAVQMAVALKPQIITMDLEMPDGNGLEATEQIMAYAPTRIMVVTGMPRFDGLDASFEALSRGALEMIPKTTAWPGTEEEQKNIITLIRRLASIPVLFHPKAARKKRILGPTSFQKTLHSQAKRSLIAIGASTGGPGVLRMILNDLPTNFSVPIIIVQHLSDVFAQGFIDWLNTRIKLPVQEALPGTAIRPNNVYVAVRGSHITITSRGWIEACHAPPRMGHCPAVDVLFESVATELKENGLGVLLTGMGKDGASGLLQISQMGGTTIVQDQTTSTVFGMPQAAIEIGAAQHVLAKQDIGPFLMRKSHYKKGISDLVD